jgi:hypothetical protein
MGCSKSIKMEIKLKRAGGIIPLKKEAAKVVAWSEDELQKVLTAIKRNDQSNTRGRDMQGYSLEANGKSTPVDIDKVPAAYKHLFEKLVASLKPVKF